MSVSVSRLVSECDNVDKENSLLYERDELVLGVEVVHLWYYR